MRHDGWPSAQLFPNGAVITMGVFDGFHRGHQRLLDRTVSVARSRNLPAVLVTFSPHPLTVVSPERAPFPLMSVGDRVSHASERGADHIVVLEFNRELAAQSHHDFVADGLVSRLGCQALVVGENFRCGHRGAGDVAFLRRAGARHGFTVEIVDLVRQAGRTCSSTEIRRALVGGDVVAVRNMLGRDDEQIVSIADNLSRR